MILCRELQDIDWKIDTMVKFNNKLTQTLHRCCRGVSIPYTILVTDKLFLSTNALEGITSITDIAAYASSSKV